MNDKKEEDPRVWLQAIQMIPNTHIISPPVSPLTSSSPREFIDIPVIATYDKDVISLSVINQNLTPSITNIAMPLSSSSEIGMGKNNNIDSNNSPLNINDSNNKCNIIPPPSSPSTSSSSLAFSQYQAQVDKV
jgi:hypothetical protein